MCIAGRRGALIDDLPHDDLAAALFAESCGRLVVEVQPRRVSAFMKVMGERAQRIGTVTDDAALTITGVDPIPLQSLVDAFNGADA
jgi:phosphoribosylformylglycinamidine synthase